MARRRSGSLLGSLASGFRWLFAFEPERPRKRAGYGRRCSTLKGDGKERCQIRKAERIEKEREKREETAEERTQRIAGNRGEIDIRELGPELARALVGPRMRKNPAHKRKKR